MNSLFAIVVVLPGALIGKLRAGAVLLTPVLALAAERPGPRTGHNFCEPERLIDACPLSAALCTR